MISYSQASRIKNCYMIIKEWESTGPKPIDEVFRKTITQKSIDKPNIYNNVFYNEGLIDGVFLGGATVLSLISASLISICAAKHIYRKCSRNSQLNNNQDITSRGSYSVVQMSSIPDGGRQSG